MKSVSTQNWQWKKKKTIINPQIEVPCETGSNVWPVFISPLGTVGGKLPCSVGWLTGGCSGKLNTKGAVENALEKHTFGLIPTTSWKWKEEISEEIRRQLFYFHHMPGEIGSGMWLLFAPSLWGKLPFSFGWLTGEYLGNCVEGIGTIAAPSIQ